MPYTDQKPVSITVHFSLTFCWQRRIVNEILTLRTSRINKRDLFYVQFFEVHQFLIFCLILYRTKVIHSKRTFFTFNCHFFPGDCADSDFEYLWWPKVSTFAVESEWNTENFQVLTKIGFDCEHDGRFQVRSYGENCFWKVKWVIVLGVSLSFWSEKNPKQWSKVVVLTATETAQVKCFPLRASWNRSSLLQWLILSLNIKIFEMWELFLAFMAKRDPGKELIFECTSISFM